MSSDTRTALERATTQLKNDFFKGETVETARKYLLGESQLKPEEMLTAEQKVTLKAARDAQGWWIRFWGGWILGLTVGINAFNFLFQFVSFSNTVIRQWQLWVYHLLFDAIGMMATVPVIVLVATRFSKFAPLIRQVHVFSIIANTLVGAGEFFAGWKVCYYWRICASAGWVENLAVTPDWWINSNPIALCGQYSGWANALAVFTFFDAIASMTRPFIIWYVMTANDNWALLTLRRKTGQYIEDLYNQDPIEAKADKIRKFMKKDMKGKLLGFRHHNPASQHIETFIGNNCSGVKKVYMPVPTSYRA